jgi:hypothetical protein
VLILERGERAEIRVDEAAELFHIGLPNLDGLSFPLHHKLEAVT